MLFLKNQEKYRLFNALMCLKRDCSVYYDNRKTIDEAINDAINGQVDEKKIYKLFSAIQEKAPQLGQRCKEVIKCCLSVQESKDDEKAIENRQVEAINEIIAIFEYYLKNNGMLKTMIPNNRHLNQIKFVR